jgi:hypothetical protein
MKMTTMAGFALIALGVIALAYQGITYKTRETVLDVGPIHATAERQKRLPLPPLVGIAFVVGGVVLLMLGRKRAS